MSNVKTVELGECRSAPTNTMADNGRRRAALWLASLLLVAASGCFGPEDALDHFADELTIPPELGASIVVPKDEDEMSSNAGIRETDEFTLRNGIQPGVYKLALRINPGEQGVVYLKAFEVTKGTQLSGERLKEASSERVGWSTDLAKKFLYDKEFVIYEGDWGKPYAARIEVWFVPDSGKPERKLMERVCKIEGWQR